MADFISITMTATAARFASRLQGFARRMADDGSKAVQVQAVALRAELVATSPVDTGYLRAHWSPVTPGSSPLVWKIQNSAPYAPILEYGGYRGIGPKTVGLGGGSLGEGFVAGAGIYSRQAPLGFVRRALANTAEPLRVRIRTLIGRAWMARDMGGGWPNTPPSPRLPEGTDLGALFGITLGRSSGVLSPQVRDVMAQLQRATFGTKRRR